MSYKAYDDDGNEVALTEMNTLCPIEHATEARQIAYDYLTNVEKCQVSLDQMLSILLRPIGGTEATHIWCPRTGWTNQLQMQIDTMNSYNLSWMGNRAYTIEDSKEELLSKLVCVTSPASELLAYLQLEEI